MDWNQTPTGFMVNISICWQQGPWVFSKTLSTEISVKRYHESGGIVHWSGEKLLILVHCSASLWCCQNLTTKMQKESMVHLNCTSIEVRGVAWWFETSFLKDCGSGGDPSCVIVRFNNPSLDTLNVFHTHVVHPTGFFFYLFLPI